MQTKTPNRSFLMAVLREEKIIARIGETETRRLELTRALASLVGSDSGPRMRVAELVGHVDEGAREELLDLRDEIRGLADRLDRLNTLNRTLAVRSADHYQMYIALLSGKDPDAKTHTKKGLEGDEPSSFVFDQLA